MRGLTRVLLSLAPLAVSLDNNVTLPPRGFTTWQSFNFNLSAVSLMAVADGLVSSGLAAAGFNVVWIDDGWPSCSRWAGAPGVSACAEPAPRGADGRVIPDVAKFPAGLAPVMAYFHARGLLGGIYTAPHAVTCGGYTGALGHEAVDAAAFAAWGVDAVKLDAGCRTDCSLFDGCLRGSLSRMRDALNGTGRHVVLYVDDGNPTSGPRVVNPHGRGFPDSALTRTHIARQWAEQVVAWGPGLANMYKLWFDRDDTWHSLLDNVAQQANFAWFQAPGAFLAPDQMTVGQGGMTAGQYRAEFYLYAALSAPMFLSAPPAALGGEALAMLTNAEILAVQADADAVMASPVWRTTPAAAGDGGRWAVDVWVKPLADGAFVWVLVNRDPAVAHDVALLFGDGGDGSYTDIFPATMPQGGSVRDLAARADLGQHAMRLAVSVPPLDARIFKVTPGPAPAVAAAAAAAATGGGAWALVWEDTFDSGELNTSSWTVAHNMTHGSSEWQLYVASAVRVVDGALAIVTDAASAVGPDGRRVYEFTSGWVDTKGKVEATYGKFEARIQLPQPLSSVWPAFWLVDDNNHCWPTGAEIDILEAVGGFRDDAIFGTYHWGAKCGIDEWSSDGQRNGAVPHPPHANFSAAFHTFAAFWNRTAISWAVDGAVYVSRHVGDPANLFVPSWPLFTILNTAMAAWGGGVQPPPRVGFPVTMLVDSVAVYAWSGPGGPTGDFPIPYNATGLHPQS